MSATNTYPIIIFEAGESYIDEIDRLAPVATLAEAKQAARDAGYTVIDDGEGGDCETTTWGDPVDEYGHRDDYYGTQRTYHLITVLPKEA